MNDDMLTREEQALMDAKFLAGDVFIDHGNTVAEKADIAHLVEVINRHETGFRLVTVLACDEQVDGAWWTVLARDSSGVLGLVQVSDEPGWSDVERVRTY